ncbi:MAG: helix-turn-helix domain-containing protein [Pseudonocardiaceae bacterium]
MADRRPGQELARRRLGDALRRYREKSNVRIEAAAGELECSAAKISRLENGLAPAKLWEVRVLLNLYKVRDRTTRSRMERWAKHTREPGWWEDDTADLVSALRSGDNSLYLAAETDASRVRMYCTPVLPSLLQTPDYAAAHTRVRRPDWSESDVARFTEFRLKRQESVLRESDPVRLDAVVDEAAARRMVGSRATHLAQLRWLADTLDAFAATGRDALQVRVLPFSAGVPSRALSAFTIIEPRQPEVNRPMVFLEDTFGGSWAGVGDVETMSAIFAELVESALDPEHSRHFLREVVERL